MRGAVKYLLLLAAMACVAPPQAFRYRSTADFNAELARFTSAEGSAIERCPVAWVPYTNIECDLAGGKR